MPKVDAIRDQTLTRGWREAPALCAKRGLLDDPAADRLADEEPVQAALTAASVRGITATGARPGQRLRRVLKDPATGGA